jgi:hypothetical protein
MPPMGKKQSPDIVRKKEPPGPLKSCAKPPSRGLALPSALSEDDDAVDDQADYEEAEGSEHSSEGLAF